jgi:hypothetical protein
MMRRLLVVVALALAAGPGCGALNVTPRSPEEQVAARAKTYYQALIDKDYTAAYGHLTPTYRSQVTKIAHFTRFNPPFTYVGVDVHKVVCENVDVCKATVVIRYKDVQGLRAAPRGEHSNVFDERWLREDGEWWRYVSR